MPTFDPSTQFESLSMPRAHRGANRELVPVRGTKSAFAYACGLSLARTYQLLFKVKPELRGLEHLPPGPKILAGNHPNASDILLLVPLLPERVTVVSQASIFHLPLIGWILRESGQIQVRPDARQAAFVEACHALKRGRTILIFPEGRLNPDGALLKAGTGAVRISLATGAPIVPLGIHVARRNTISLHRAGKDGTHTGRWQLCGRFTVSLGVPWSVADEMAGKRNPAKVHELTCRLMDRIYSLAQRAGEGTDQEEDQCASPI